MVSFQHMPLFTVFDFVYTYVLSFAPTILPFFSHILSPLSPSLPLLSLSLPSPHHSLSSPPFFLSSLLSFSSFFLLSSSSSPSLLFVFVSLNMPMVAAAMFRKYGKKFIPRIGEQLDHA